MVSSSESLLPEEEPKMFRRDIWHSVRAAAAQAAVVFMLGGFGIGVGEIAIQNERLTNVTAAEIRVEQGERDIARELDFVRGEIRHEVRHPTELHGTACICEGPVGAKNDPVRMSMSADCDARAIADIRKTFPGLRCRREESAEGSSSSPY
jgi:hypothetical protein